MRIFFRMIFDFIHGVLKLSGRKISDVFVLWLWIVPFGVFVSLSLSSALLMLAVYEPTSFVLTSGYLFDHAAVCLTATLFFTVIFSVLVYKWYYSKILYIYSLENSEYTKGRADRLAHEIIVVFITAATVVSVILHIGAKTYWLYVVLLLVKLFVVIPLICVAVNAVISKRIGKLELDAVRFSHDDKYNGLN